MSSIANYNGKQPNNTSYIKNFVSGSSPNIWQILQYNPLTGENNGIITPTSTNNKDLYIPGNLYVNGSIINPSDIYLKNNIDGIDEELTNKILNITPKQFTFKNDITNKLHYGFIAQDFENEYSNLVSIKPDKDYANLKSINYLEIIPLLVSKIQLMQKEIDTLKDIVNIKIII